MERWFCSPPTGRMYLLSGFGEETELLAQFA